MDAIFGFSGLGSNWDYIRILEQNGYTPDGDNREHNRAAVMERLADLCESETVQEERILWWEQDGQADGEAEVYLVYPVTLALILEEYGYAERLFDKGYEVEYVLPDKQIYHYRKGITRKAYAIHRTQVLMARDNIPDRLLVRIYGELSAVHPVFSFGEDVWDNPFLSHEVDQVVRQNLPAMYGLEKIYAKHTQWLEGMLADGGFDAGKITYLSTDMRHKLMRRLLKYFKGMGEDLAQYIEIFAPRMETMDASRESRAEVKFWMKLLPALEEACSLDEVSEKAFWEAVITLIGNLPKTKHFLNRDQREEVGQVLWKIAKRSKPEDYTIQTFLKYVNSKKAPEDFGYYLKVWKHITGEPLVLDRMGATLWDMLDKIFGDNQKYSANARKDRQDERLLWGITFMESVDEMVAVEEKISEYEESGILTELICILLDFESEELVLACLKNKFLPGTAISACIKSALKFQKLRVVPALIMAQKR